MKFKESGLKVFYSGTINRVLDDVLEAILKAFGYKRWASGMNIEDGVRDLAFTRQNTEEKDNG